MPQPYPPHLFDVDAPITATTPLVILALGAGIHSIEFILDANGAITSSGMDPCDKHRGDAPGSTGAGLSGVLPSAKVIEKVAPDASAFVGV